MGINFIWLGSIALEFFILLRGVQTRLARAYPLFYIYIACDLVIDLCRLWYYTFRRSSYDSVYWYTAPLLILMSYLILLEIYRELLSAYPGIARLAQEALLVALAGTALVVTAIALHKSYESLLGVWADMGADLRYVQAALLFVLLLLLARYGILFGWNMQGISVGYAFLVGIDVLYHVLLFRPGGGSSLILRGLHPIYYFLTLLIWTAAVWRNVPAAVRPRQIEIEHDYKMLSEWMRSTIDRVTHQIVRSIKR